LQKLSSATPKVYLAIASSAGRKLYDIKTANIPVLQTTIPPENRIFGDDPDMHGAEKKPAPDIFLLALRRLNAVLAATGKEELRPEECLVFEDSIAGVEAGRRAGMWVVWVPHEGLARVTRGREQSVLMGRTEDGRTTPVYSEEGEGPELPGGRAVAQDGWAVMVPSLEEFDYARYGIGVVVVVVVVLIYVRRRVAERPPI
jgi:pseudouridine 5'-phosphatase